MYPVAPPVNYMRTNHGWRRDGGPPVSVVTTTESCQTGTTTVLGGEESSDRGERTVRSPPTTVFSSPETKKSCSVVGDRIVECGSPRMTGKRVFRGEAVGTGT